MTDIVKARERLEAAISDHPAGFVVVSKEDLRTLLSSEGEAQASISRLRAYPFSKPYDPTHPDDLQRLVREVRGYLQTCRGTCGSDTQGRDHAIAALDALAPDLIARACGRET